MQGVSRKIIPFRGSGRPNCHGLQAQLGFKDCLPAFGAVSRPVFLSVFARLLLFSNLLQNHPLSSDDLPPGFREDWLLPPSLLLKLNGLHGHDLLRATLPGGSPPLAFLWPLCISSFPLSAGSFQPVTMFRFFSARFFFHVALLLCPPPAPCTLACGSQPPHRCLCSLPHFVLSASHPSGLWWPHVLGFFRRTAFLLPALAVLALHCR